VRAGTRSSTPPSSPARWACPSPEPEIFAYVLRLLGVTASEAVFVDDLAHNVRAVRDLSLVAVHHPSSDDTVAELARLLEHLSD
jgi:FMN phosphatase YigB (HAD superfamily)